METVIKIYDIPKRHSLTLKITFTAIFNQAVFSNQLQFCTKHVLLRNSSNKCINHLIGALSLLVAVSH